jgi:hypothetical protein
MHGALLSQPALKGLRIDEIVIEAQSAVDEFSGPRNHDLVVRGHLPGSQRVVVCIEAKAGEDLGPTVAQQDKAASAAKTKNPASNATARLDGLLERFVPHPVDEPRVQSLRYQLLTALGGTLSEAADYGAAHAVLMVHDFLADQRDKPEVVAEHDRDLRNLVTTVFDLEPPCGGYERWCVAAGSISDAPDVEFYVGRAVTDLRAATLEPRAT